MIIHVTWKQSYQHVTAIPCYLQVTKNLDYHHTMVLRQNFEINPMTFDYNWRSLVRTLPLVLITGITNRIFPCASFDIISGTTRDESHDVYVIVEKKYGS